MTGDHQILVMDLAENTIAPVAGSGKEERADGNFSKSGFAQPSSLAFDDKNLLMCIAPHIFNERRLTFSLSENKIG